MPRESEPVAVRRGTYAKGRAKREAIIQAAIGLFGEVGYHAASLRDIAARADLSHPGLLHHFPTKDALLAAVLAHRDEVDNEAIAEDVAQGRSGVEAFLRLVGRNARRRPVVELYAALSAEATSPDHPAHAYFAARYELTVQQCTLAFAELQRAGALRAWVDPAWAGRALVALTDGLQVQWLLSLDGPASERVDMERDLRAFVRALTPES